MGIETLLISGYAMKFEIEAIARTTHALNHDVMLMRDGYFSVNRQAHDFSQRTNMPTVARVMNSTYALAPPG